MIKILRMAATGGDFRLPAFGIMPILRYIPSRHLMQRMVKRTVELPENFNGF